MYYNLVPLRVGVNVYIHVEEMLCVVVAQVVVEMGEVDESACEVGVVLLKQHHDVVMTPNSYLYFDSCMYFDGKRATTSFSTSSTNFIVLSLPAQSTLSDTPHISQTLYGPPVQPSSG